MAIPESEYISWIGSNADYLRDTTNFRKWGQLTNGLKDYIEQRFNDLNDGTYNPTLLTMTIPSDQLITWDENQYLNTVDTFDIWRKKTNGLKVYIDDYFLANVNTVKIYLTAEQFAGDCYRVRVNKIETPIANDLSFTITYQRDNGAVATTSKFLASSYTSDFLPFQPNYIVSVDNTGNKNFKLLTLRVYYQNGTNPIKTFDIDKNFYTGDDVNGSTTDPFTITDLTPGGGNENVSYSLQQSVNVDNHAYSYFSIFTNNLGLGGYVQDNFVQAGALSDIPSTIIELTISCDAQFEGSGTSNGNLSGYSWNLSGKITGNVNSDYKYLITDSKGYNSGTFIRSASDQTIFSNKISTNVSSLDLQKIDICRVSDGLVLATYEISKRFTFTVKSTGNLLIGFSTECSLSMYDASDNPNITNLTIPTPTFTNLTDSGSAKIILNIPTTSL